MRKTPHPFISSDAPIGVSELERQLSGWLLDGDIRQHSPQTLAGRRLVGDKLIGFLKGQSLTVCGRQELRRFFS